MSAGYAVLASDAAVLEAGDFKGEMSALAYVEMGGEKLVAARYSDRA